MLRRGSIASLFVFASVALGACATDASPDVPGKDETAQVTSRVDLDTYLRTTSPSPLDALAVGARQRFVRDVVFGSSGVERLNAAELVTLTPDEVYDILRLFGMERTTGSVIDAASHRGEHPDGEAKPPLLIP